MTALRGDILHNKGVGARNIYSGSHEYLIGFLVHTGVVWNSNIIITNVPFEALDNPDEGVRHGLTERAHKHMPD